MANGKNIAYVRVSTLEQNEARQREALQPYNIDKWFIEKASGKDTQRPKLQEMLEYIREDDTVYVEEFSRLGRSTADLLATVKQIEDTGAKFISLKEKFDTYTPAGKLQMTMMAAIAEFERAMILESSVRESPLPKGKANTKAAKPSAFRTSESITRSICPDRLPRLLSQKSLASAELPWTSFSKSTLIICRNSKKRQLLIITINS